MRIGLVLVTYGMFPEKLFASIPDQPHHLIWHVAHHGPDAGLSERIGARVCAMAGTFKAHGVNRGLSRSWNDGIKHCIDLGADMVFLLNDDLHFKEEGFRAFVDFCAAELSKDSVGMTFVTGYETDGPYKGVTQNQGYACCVMAPRLIDRVGYFDENFFPAYFEDVDYTRRMGMTGLQVAIDARCLVEHERSQTSRTDSNIAAAFARSVKLCGDYLISKWGGDLAHAAFTRPFNQFGPKIEFSARAAPYGADLNRPDKD